MVVKQRLFYAFTYCLESRKVNCRFDIVFLEHALASFIVKKVCLIELEILSRDLLDSVKHYGL